MARNMPYNMDHGMQHAEGGLNGFMGHGGGGGGDMHSQARSRSMQEQQAVAQYYAQQQALQGGMGSSHHLATRSLMSHGSDGLAEGGGSYAAGAGPAGSTKRTKKKRAYKKAPGAPKRGRSAYVLYSIAKREEIKASLPEDAKVTEVMKAIAGRWRALDADGKKEWEDKATKDKQRYESELKVYEGPLKVPNKRQKKDPDAPKRAMSAFLLFSQAMRPRLKAMFPTAKNADLSKLLGEDWGKMTAEEKEPFRQRATEDAGRYKEAMDEWNLMQSNKKPEAGGLPPAPSAMPLGMGNAMMMRGGTGGHLPTDFMAMQQGAHGAHGGGGHQQSRLYQHGGMPDSMGRPYSLDGSARVGGHAGGLGMPQMQYDMPEMQQQMMMMQHMNNYNNMQMPYGLPDVDSFGSSMQHMKHMPPPGGGQSDGHQMHMQRGMHRGQGGGSNSRSHS
jgi:high mobility group protein B2